MSPPLPPSPPSGPPYSMNFSRRKLTAPGPPAPERMKILAWSRKCMGVPLAIIVAKGQRGQRHGSKATRRLAAISSAGAGLSGGEPAPRSRRGGLCHEMEVANGSVAGAESAGQ